MPIKTKSEARKKVEAEPCHCSRCVNCGGAGSIRYSNKQFDEDDTEPCEDCNGGISEVCDRCRLLEEMDAN